MLVDKGFYIWMNRLVLESFFVFIRVSLSSLFFFYFSIFFSCEKTRSFEKIFFDKICSRIHKNELIYKLCTILEWDKCQQLADFIKFVTFWFLYMQLYKTFVQFFFNQTLGFYQSFPQWSWILGIHYCAMILS